MVDVHLSFGNKYNPLGFSRATRLLTHMWTRLSARTIPNSVTYRSPALQALLGSKLSDLPFSSQLQPLGFVRRTRH